VKQRTHELEKANQELEAFSYSVSHDLRAPLRAITGFAKMLLEDYTQYLDDEGNRYLTVIDESAEKMGNLIDDLLGFSLMSRKEKVLEAIDMEALCQEVFEELKREYDDSRWTLSLDTLPMAQGDRRMIRQVLINLMSNSFKFTAEEPAPWIVISSSSNEDYNTYNIKDNGVGFDASYKGKLFQVFQRLHGDAEFKGTGIGLSIVKRIIDRHGGDVWGDSKEGEGAEFVFQLPVYKNDK